MIDKTFLRFLQEIVGKDKTEVAFPITEYMEWVGIPFEQLDDVLKSVTDDLHEMMNFLCTLELLLAWLTQRKYARLVTSFTVLETVIRVEFAEWTEDAREEEDWLVKWVEALEAVME